MKQIEDYNKVLPIIELYTAVQGEGSRAGFPTIVIRTTGCTHRCQFAGGGWCDSWYTSIHPEKGHIRFGDILEMYEKNPHIKEMMLTGGSPTMHPALVNSLATFCHTNNIVMTIETEGSHEIQTDHPIGLISLSPKFSNSIPQIGTLTPKGDIVDERMVKQHNKFRLNYEAMKFNITNHVDYHIKPVINPIAQPEVWKEVLECLDKLEVPKNKVYIMPPGDKRELLFLNYGPVMDFCRDNGYNFTGRPHIIAFDDQRYV